MGVWAVSIPDVRALVHSLTGVRVSEFTSAVEFGGSVSVPLTGEWMLGIDYGYLLGSISVPDAFGRGAFTFTAHVPSLVLQYALAEEETYHVRVGAGAGYHWGAFSQEYSTLDTRATCAGPGFLAALEANTALGDNLFAYLAVLVRWEFQGELTDGAGRPARGSPDGPGATFHFFAPGARLGMTYTL
jgi:hypothetical protein